MAKSWYRQTQYAIPYAVATFDVYQEYVQPHPCQSPSLSIANITTIKWYELIKR